MENDIIGLDKILKEGNQAILEALPFGIVIYDREAKMEYVNDVVINIFQITDKKAHLEKRLSIFEDPAVAKEILEMARKGENIDVIVDYNMQVVSEKCYFKTGLNHILFVDAKMRYIKDSEGRIEKYILILNDVTQTRINEIQHNSKVLSVSMNALNAFTWFCDMRDSVLRFGDGFEKFGADPQEMNSMVKFASRIHPKYRQQFIDFMDEFIQRDSGDFSIEYEIDINNNGQYEWWECRGTMDVVRYGKQFYKHLYGMDINIDKHKRNELTLLKNKMELDLLNKQNQIILNNTNSGLAFISNDYEIQWENFSSFMPNHPIAKKFKKGLKCYNTVKDRHSPCIGCVVHQSYVSETTEVKEVESDGVVAELTATPIFDGNQKRMGTVLKVIDITEKKRVHREIEAAKNKAETANRLMLNIIDCLPCLLFIKDVEDDFKHIIANQYFCNVVGRDHKDVIGKTDYEIFSTKEEADRCHRDDLIPIETGMAHIFEEETYFDEKRVIWQTTKVCIKDVDGRRLLIAVSLDITDKMLSYHELQEAKEIAEESNRLKSAFLANMSHEIRTPLNAIVGFSGLMMEATCDAEKNEYFNIINTNNDLLLRLISDILDLSKIEAGMMEFKSVEFDMADLFKELSSMFEMRITNPRVKFICESPYNSCIICFDKGRLTQVITNFMTNAIKFTPKGEIVMGYEYVDDGIRVYVRDSGIGIAHDKLHKVFDRFEKLDNFAQGTGLGMAICKAIAKMCNGKIDVESEEGKGSIFCLWIPIDVLSIT